MGDTPGEGTSGADALGGGVDALGGGINALGGGVGGFVPPCGVISSIACPLFCCTVFPLPKFLGAAFSLPENKIFIHVHCTCMNIYKCYMHIIRHIPWPTTVSTICFSLLFLWHNGSGWMGASGPLGRARGW